jgi:hypothetical protein
MLKEFIKLPNSNDYKGARSKFVCLFGSSLNKRTLIKKTMKNEDFSCILEGTEIVEPEL